MFVFCIPSCSRGLWYKTIIILVVSVIVLQIVHLILLSQLESRRSQVRLLHKTRRDENSQVNDVNKLVQDVGQSSVLDSSGDYKIVHGFSKSDVQQQNELHKSIDLSIVTQGTLNNLHHVQELALHWSGPVSLAIFLPRGNISLAAFSIHVLRKCSLFVQRFVSFHLVYPLNQNPYVNTEEFISLANVPCDLAFKKINDISGIVMNYNHSIAYPVNLLRNVARRNTITKFFMLIDIDMVPNINLYDDFLRFIAKNKFTESAASLIYRTVFIVPAFEIVENISLPRNKTELLSLLESSLNVRPFYHKLCRKCQRFTNYDEWKQVRPTDELQVAYNVEWQDSWEPFYICDNSVPLYDERFKQYGFNRISQVCEVHVAGYTFSVLNNAFLLHKGLKSPDSFYPHKEDDNARNRILFRQFKTELKDKYPRSSRKC